MKSPRLDLSYVAADQAGKHVTVNETFRRLDAVVQAMARSRTVPAEPVAPAEGDGYVLPPGATGAAWENFATGTLAAYQDGAWQAYAPAAGWQVFIEDEAVQLVHDGTGWRETAQGLPRAGINATADTTNRLTVKSDAVLFSHDDITPGSGDIRLALNRAGTGDTAAQVFQTGYVTHAEIGLSGSHDVSVKTSSDGATFREGLRLSAITADTIVSDGRKLQFEVPDLFSTPPYRIYASNDQFYFSKKTSDTDLASGSRFVFEAAGCQNTASPFWQGVQYACTAVNEGAATRYPRFSFFWSYTSKTDPTDLRFNIKPGNAGTLKTQFSIQTQEQGDIFLDGGNTVIGPTGMTGTAKLTVDGTIRGKTYTVATLPDAAAEGAGAIAYVSDETGGAVLAYSDGTDWRRSTDRAVIA
ncbi:DUF2793 domain-containing protein [Aquisalinus flavus]|uniref:DUF2793 domain-containing protein n=1 Tax=Aquisalinus flavus TaxID=1526572 RepID=A0A8J2Y6G3_9PROT|nr:DUF2793 domain-containing protein [Aquisalinus flavus]MBD0426234.1 DUF2793 domain-containing protein [Aquisalinus flavus]UNE48194.1 DUF2793 domain-containing protein [Aquisalinus flavus]GGD09550.1 hypothetical protein GCM10011342_18030 [Aquisalinus flavus]